MKANCKGDVYKRQVQTGPQSGTIGSTYTWKAGGICVNQEGKRFVNEQEARVDVREVALERCV